jgi:hypothetical protein
METTVMQNAAQSGIQVLPDNIGLIIGAAAGGGDKQQDLPAG